MIRRRFAIASSFLSKMMNPKMKKQTLCTSSETPDPSLSGVYQAKKKTQANQQITSTSLPNIYLIEAMKKRNYLDWALMREVIASKARNSNFIFSPASINAALTMMAAGSGSCSEELNTVYNEIVTTVLTDSGASGGPKISAVNGVWVDQSHLVNPLLKDISLNVFNATFAQVDFRSKAEQVRKEVNKWASHHTNGLIKDLLPHGSVTSKTNQVYGNALYFKGAWKQKFIKSYTIVEEFHLLDGSSVHVPFMRTRKKQYVAAYNGFKVLRLPYQHGDGDKNREFSMYFYLPNKRDGLDELMAEMASTPGFVDKYTPRKDVELGNLRISKFKISFGFSVSRDFSSLELDEAGGLYHKACVEIDEEGSEAAASSCVSGLVCYHYQKKIEFVADHPFLFLIREDRTGTVLFAGQIFDPSKSS